MLPYLGSLTQANIALTTALVTAVSALGFYVYQKKLKRNSVPTVWEPVGKVTNLFLYPLKSGRRIVVSRLECTEVGLQQCVEDEKSFQLLDRSFVIYGDSNKEFKTARTYPKMILIEVSVHDENHLAFDAPGMRQLYVKVPNAEEEKYVEVLMRGEKISGLDCGDEAATWISRYIFEVDSGLRLAYFDNQYRRDVTKSYSKFLKVYPNLDSKAMGRFTDFGSCLLINEASVRDMNSKIVNSNVTHENFRPNIVIDGINAIPYAEDNWDWIKIGDVVFRTALPCTRCILTTIDPNTGVRNVNREPLNTLEKYRLLTDPEKKALSPKSPVFGSFIGIKTPGKIAIDDVVYIGKNE